MTTSHCWAAGLLLVSTLALGAPALGQTEQQRSGFDVAAALDLSEEQLSWMAAVDELGPNHPVSLDREAIFAMTLSDAGDFDTAMFRWRRLVGVFSKPATAPQDPRMLTLARIFLAEAMLKLGDRVRGEPLAQAAYEESVRMFGVSDQRYTDRIRGALTEQALRVGDFDAAARWLVETVEAEIADTGPSDRTAGFGGSAADILIEANRPADARAILIRSAGPEGGPNTEANRLKLLELQEDWESLESAAAAYSAKRRQDATPAAISDAQSADLARVNAMIHLARRGRPADYATAVTVLDRVRTEQEADPTKSGLTGTLTHQADVYALWPGHQDLDRAVEVWTAIVDLRRSTLGDNARLTWSARLGQAIALKNAGRADMAERVFRTVLGAPRDRTTAEDRMYAAIGVSILRADAGDPPGAYAVLRSAGRDYLDYVRQPAQRREARSSLDGFNEVYRAQVSAAWGYSGRLAKTG